MTVLPSSMRRMATPMAGVGYVTWATVAYSVWHESLQWPPWHGWGARSLAMALLLVFLAAFVLRLFGSALGRGAFVALTAAMVGATLSLVAFGPQSATPVLLIIVASTVAASAGSRTVWLLLAVVNAAFLGVLWRRWPDTNVIFTLAIYGAFELFAVVTTRAMLRAERSAVELRLTNAELLATRALLAESARDGERLRVSRELHDVAGHKLTALALNIELLRQDAGVGARHEVEVIGRVTAELLADLRSVVSSLRRDDGLDLGDALRRFVAVFPTPSVHLDIAADARVEDAERAQTVLRVTQEALTNAARHAHAANVWVSLRPHARGLELVIEDDGGFQGTIIDGHGVTGMRERMAALGGRLDIARGARGGLRVAAWVPPRVPA